MKPVNQSEVLDAVVGKPPVVRRIVGVLLPLVIVAAAVVGYRGLVASKKTIEPLKVVEKSWPVSTVPVVIDNQTPELRLYGEAVAGRQVDMRTLVMGEIIETGENFKLGGIIKKGDMLVEVDAFEYVAALEEAQGSLLEAEARLLEYNARVQLEIAQLEVARFQLDLAEKDLKRAVKLKKQGSISQKAVDDREVTLSLRRQAIAQRTSNIEIERARASQQAAVIERLKTAVRRAQRSLRNTRLIAPFDAYVAKVDGEVGRFVSANDRVATLIDSRQIDVRFSLSDGQYGRIIADAGTVIGRPVRVIWRVGINSYDFAGKIERVSAQISASNGGIDVFARLDLKSAKTPLRTGAFVEVYLKDRTYKNVARLPETSLYDNNRVYVIEAGRLVEKKVELVGYAGSDVLVRGALKPGEKLLSSRLSAPVNGLLVVEK